MTAVAEPASDTPPEPAPDIAVRTLRPEEYRAAGDMFAGTLHSPPLADKYWTDMEPSYEPGRSIGAFRSGELVGMAQTFGSRMAVPGGSSVPFAAVTRVGVRADHTRRGAATAMMRGLLESVTEPVAGLWASEGEIYGRFGYGVATWGQDVLVDRRAAVFHPDAPVGGVVRLVETEEADKVLPEAFERVGLARTGAMTRPAFYWPERRVLARFRNQLHRIGVHRGPDGDDGFVVYHVDRPNDGSSARTRLKVDDLQAANPAAWAGLWRFLLSVDLVGEVFAESRPVDEPVRWLFTDPRACRVTDLMDEIWLRLVDVPTALAARSYQDGGPAVIEVVDALLPANSGRYRISGDGARRTDEPAGLALDASALASLYLGGARPSALALTGRLRVLDPAALDAADQLFTTDVVPWCGTFF